MAAACTGSLWAGPPFQTDDPQPVDFRHYEFYVFGNTDGTPVETDALGQHSKPTGALFRIFNFTLFCLSGPFFLPIIPSIFQPEQAPALTA